MGTFAIQFDRTATAETVATRTQKSRPNRRHCNIVVSGSRAQAQEIAQVTESAEAIGRAAEAASENSTRVKSAAMQAHQAGSEGTELLVASTERIWALNVRDVLEASSKKVEVLAS